MSATSEKISKIINEIEGLSYNETIGKLSTNEVMDILLGNDSLSKAEEIEGNLYTSTDIVGDNNSDIRYQFDMRELKHWKENNNQLYSVPYYRSIPCFHKHFRKLIVGIKRIIRKACRFFMEPILEQQSSFNASVTSSINALYNNEVVTEAFIYNQNQINIYNRKIIDEKVIENIKRFENKYNTIIEKINNKINEQDKSQREQGVNTDSLDGSFYDYVQNTELSERIRKIEEKINEFDLIIQDSVETKLNTSLNEINMSLDDKLGEIKNDLDKNSINNSEYLKNQVNDKIEMVKIEIQNDIENLRDEMKDELHNEWGDQLSIIGDELEKQKNDYTIDKKTLRDLLEEQRKMLIDKVDYFDTVTSKIQSDTVNLHGAIREELYNEWENQLSLVYKEVENQKNDYTMQQKIYSDSLEEQRIMLTNEVSYLDNKIDDVELNIFRKLNENVKKNGNKVESSEKIKEVRCNQNNNIIQSTIYSKLDYFDFENQFRGSRRKIKESQQEYIKYFKNTEKVLDLGCGRGEFLELLRQNGVSAQGIDNYAEFVTYCNMKGLDAIQDDVIQYLDGLENKTLGGVFASQLIEHLTTEELIELCHLVYDKLIPGGYFIIETPNPTCLGIYMNWFYADPSHIKPVHPKTMQYFMIKTGFQNIQIVFTEQSKVGYRLPLLNVSQAQNLEEFNNGINLVSDILFGSQDYAIIAQK